MSINFNEELATLRAGALSPGHDIDLVGSRQVETKAKAGLYVVPTGDGLCDLPSTTGEVTANKGGFLTFMTDRRANADGFEWQADDYVQYMERGRIVVITEEAVSDGDDVFIRFETGTGTQLGAARTDADTATAVALPGAHFEGDHSSGLARVSYKK